MAFDLTTHTWSYSTSPPFGNYNLHGVATNDAIYLIGRYDGFYGVEFQKFTPTGGGPTGTWELMADYPFFACGPAAAWDGGDYIYVSGGDASITDCFRYSISSNQWLNYSSIPTAMKYCGGAFVQGKFYCVGGYETPTTAYAYDPATGSWTLLPPIPTAAHFATFSTTFNDDYVIIVGGGGQGGSWPSSDAVMLYDPLTNAWFYETSLPEPIGVQAARYYGNGYVVSAGGYNGWSNVSNTNAGMSFPGGEPTIPLDMEVLLTPENPPITIPATGGTLEFNIEITNLPSPMLTFGL